jgi:hypothetical protein
MAHDVQQIDLTTRDIATARHKKDFAGIRTHDLPVKGPIAAGVAT